MKARGGWSRYAMEGLKWLGLAAVFGYAILVGLMYVYQRNLTFQRQPNHRSPADAGFPEAREQVLSTDDGERIVTWLCPPAKERRPLFLMFLGNGDNLGVAA